MPRRGRSGIEISLLVQLLNCQSLEVELDVSAERAYENQAGDVIGGSGGFDPGADWTEIPRA